MQGAEETRPPPTNKRATTTPPTDSLLRINYTDPPDTHPPTPDSLTVADILAVEGGSSSSDLGRSAMESANRHRSRSQDPQVIPVLSINDIHIPHSIPHIALPRWPLLHKNPKLKPRRPSTASSAEERSPRLPSATPQAPSDHRQRDHPRPHMSFSSGDISTSTDFESISIQEMNRRAHAALAGLRAEASRLSAPDILPSPFDPSPTDELSQPMAIHDSIDDHVDYDWATFINAYALGRWDPLRTPHPPRSHLQPPHHGSTCRTSHATPPDRSSPDFLCDSPLTPPEDDWMPNGHHDSSSFSDTVEHEALNRSSIDPLIQSAPPQFYIPASVLPIPSSAPAQSTYTPVLPDMAISRGPDHRATVPSTLSSSRRLRNSVADLRLSSSTSSIQHSESARTSNQSTCDVTTSAAAIRWAGARVSIAPLALPSPEHELTDPMRGVTATIPGSHPQDIYPRPDPLPVSPNGWRKTRLSSFWQGTQDVEDSERLPFTQPPESEEQGRQHSSTDIDRKSHQSRLSSSSIPFLARPAPATAPVRFSNGEQEDEDYFGHIEVVLSEEHIPQPSPPRAPVTNSIRDAVTLPLRSDTDMMRQASAPPFTTDPVTVPALPRRICLTRQTSAPLPTLALYERRMRSSRPASDSAPNLAGRAAKEEHMFNELGYLAPPNPPDEIERRRALYKFNIWNTGRDSNFDRICHLVKLVFSTRIVTISLVDGTEVFLKSTSGFASQNIPRASSFDAHALLQRDDEPTVVLDTYEDWRFARNPLVIGHPHVRFLAASPLRTQDGYNIGTLTILDDTPRREFSPRQRHTLKEFAQIAMRELELWRDKIQLRIRDRIQTSMEEFTRECLEVDRDTDSSKGQKLSLTSMEQVYEHAARLVKRTLDVEGAIVIDVSHVDIIETVGAESCTAVTIHHADPAQGTSVSSLCADQHAKLQEFFAKFQQGKISEGIVPAALKPYLPTRIQYALTVPIYNIDKRPFAILCAYSTGERTTPFLEGHELSYLRAIGVIILSAVLKRRMILADKAKSLFISNISHELRTPLHGILASAELLSETHLDHSQASFLQTVQACGTSLVETVNHVLDFTKLSGNVKAGGVETVIHRSKVDLMQLVEEATEGCWIGHRARMFTSEIGSVYSPPKQQDRQNAIVASQPKSVETVINIEHIPKGWAFRCEKGGIRRILMNLFGNSLKFTSDGYVHVMLRQVPATPNQSPKTVKIELTVADTGKGISQNFLKNQLFHPFSQENPLQTGTGLGLAIVNSIVRSNSIDGKVDVWSAEGVGTEIKITFTAEAVEDEETSNNDAELVKLYNSLKRPSIHLVGFTDPHRGVQLLRETLTASLSTRWGFTLADEGDPGDIVIVNEDHAAVAKAVLEKETSRPYIILSSARGDPRLMKTVTDYERIGGFCRVAYKPVGPGRLYSVLKLCIHALNITDATAHRRTSSGILANGRMPQPNGTSLDGNINQKGSHSSILPRRLSEENSPPQGTEASRPSLGPRSVTIHPLASWNHMEPMQEQEEPREYSDTPMFRQSPSSPTITVGTGGTLLKSAVDRSTLSLLESKGPVKVLVVEDNVILRNLLIKWLKNKGFHYRDAVDGLDGVRAFEEEQFDVVLVDLSMPVLDGVGATAQMRDIEFAKRTSFYENGSPPRNARPARILALTGMSSLEDKRRAFEAGVDGYLVKPVAFKTLDSMFQKLGFS